VEKILLERETVLNMFRNFGLALLMLGVVFAEAHAKTEGWCAPASVTLNFSDQQEREAVKIEVRSPTQTCTIYEVDEAVGSYRQPEMHIDFHGRAFSVPNSCLMGFSFRLSDLVVAIGDRGIGVRMLGKSIDRGIRMRAVVYTVDNDVLCNQSAE
jgi:hypothetical protein